MASVGETPLMQLYGRISRIAETIGATATHAAPDALHIWGADGFTVVFKPAYPLSGGTLSVRATRVMGDARKRDFLFIHEHGFWTSEADGANALSDNQIRVCLLPDGPPAI